MRQLIALLIINVFLSGCSKQLEDFVRTGPQRPDDGTTTTTSNPVGIKLSPGANIASGNNVSARFAITPSSRTVEGNQIKAKVSLNQSRPSAQ